MKMMVEEEEKKNRDRQHCAQSPEQLTGHLLLINSPRSNDNTEGEAVIFLLYK